MINFPRVVSRGAILSFALLLGEPGAATDQNDERMRVISAQPIVHDIRRAIRENDSVRLLSLVAPNVIVTDFRSGGTPSYRWSAWLDSRAAEHWRSDVLGNIRAFTSVGTTRAQATICVWRRVTVGNLETLESNGVMVIEMSGGLGAGWDVTQIDYVEGNCP